MTWINTGLIAAVSISANKPVKVGCNRLKGDWVECLGRVNALNRYAVGSRPPDGKVAKARSYETRLLSTAFSMSAFPLIATELRTSLHVSNVPKAEVVGLINHLVGAGEQRY